MAFVASERLQYLICLSKSKYFSYRKYPRAPIRSPDMLPYSFLKHFNPSNAICFLQFHVPHYHPAYSYSLSVLVRIALVVRRSLEPTTRIRIVDHDEGLPLSILANIAEKMHEILQLQSIISLASRTICVKHECTHPFVRVPSSSITSLISFSLRSCMSMRR